MNKQLLWVGVDVGSTTVKTTVVDPYTKELLASEYKRHNAEQAATVYELIKDAHQQFPEADFKVAVCGSGGQPFAEATGAFFIQEVVANSIAIKSFYPDSRVAIELGGQDAKVIFFRFDEETRQLVASDMRMNGSCAGGTGAFIDQIAELLDVKTEEFEGLAAKGTSVYDISGRCGVFAKTDIQPLLNQGVSKEDIALSSFHAIAKQTIGGLAQGMDINPPVIFEGGPLTFNPTLIRVFKERLMLSDDQIIIPDHPEVLVAYGTALSIGVMFAESDSGYSWKKAESALKKYTQERRKLFQTSDRFFFADQEEQEEFFQRHRTMDFIFPEYPSGTVLPVYLGIDAGSTTTKFVLLDEHENLIYKYYSNNNGDPLRVIKYSLIAMRDYYRERGISLDIRGVGTTGYGEVLFSKALKADYHTVETVAHAEAAKQVDPDVSFILDIGGQDMKAINLKSGIVTGIVLNEACSAGCGSFIETYARSLNIPVNRIASLGFKAKNPSRLGSRCTVFMNSSIITEQKNGKTTEDIMAGLCRSVIENVFTKVVRIANIESLGDHVVVQGGTFKNDAVLRAFEQYIGKKVKRPDNPGEMGAIGIALLTKKQIEEKEAEVRYTSTFIGLHDMEQFDYQKSPGHVCQFCSNNCNRTLITFSDGTRYVTGNRCERGEIIGDLDDPETKRKLSDTTKKMNQVPDMVKKHNSLLTKDFGTKIVSRKKDITIGLPRTLEFFESMPYWKAIFTSLGFKVVVSKKSTYDLFESGIQNVPSDTVCFPAKLAHGHVKDLVSKGVDRIFMPMLIRIPKENPNTNATFMCAIIQGYPMIIDKSDEPTRRHGIAFDHPIFHWYNKRLKRKQVVEFLVNTYHVSVREARKAMIEGEKAGKSFHDELTSEGKKILESLRGTDKFAVVLSGRPYHSDELVNHNLARHFVKMGIPVLTLDSLPDLHKQNLKNARMEAFNPFHTRMLSAALAVGSDPNLELAQIVSFGCGHDAIISDEMSRLLRAKSNKELLVIKLDEGDAQGPMNIRVKSFIETIRAKRESGGLPESDNELSEAYEVKFTKKDKKVRKILAPNLSPAFCKIITAAIESEGYEVYPLPVADDRAIELGKKYVHNDICFPAQVNIGEALAVLKSGKVKPENVTLGIAKNCEDCRAGHYVPLARKALDEAGYPNVPIITTGIDEKNMHPGFKVGTFFQIRMLWGMALIDGLEKMVRMTRPYEVNAGESDAVFNLYLDRLSEKIKVSFRKSGKVFQEAVDAFNRIPVDRTVRKPRVGVLGEVLMNYHPRANGNVESYLEANGMEVIEPSLSDFFRRIYVIDKDKGIRGMLPNKYWNMFLSDMTETAFKIANAKVDKYLKKFKFAEPHFDVHDIAKNVEGLIDKSYLVGEGWLMVGEIIQLAEKGVNSFVILNPFGCLPNHITGRGMIKPLKKMYPHIQILSLDYDPDTSFANIENRLQMLIITARELEKRNREVSAQEVV